MTKFIAIIDWKAAYNDGFNYADLKAKTLEEAEEEAEGLYNENVYCLMIAQKTGRQEKLVGGVKINRYTEKVEKRSGDWKAKEESNFIWRRHEGHNEVWYDGEYIGR